MSIKYLYLNKMFFKMYAYNIYLNKMSFKKYAY